VKDSRQYKISLREKSGVRGIVWTVVGPKESKERGLLVGGAIGAQRGYLGMVCSLCGRKGQKVVGGEISKESKKMVIGRK